MFSSIPVWVFCICFVIVGRQMNDPKTISRNQNDCDCLGQRDLKEHMTAAAALPAGLMGKYFECWGEESVPGGHNIIPAQQVE